MNKISRASLHAIGLVSNAFLFNHTMRVYIPKILPCRRSSHPRSCYNFLRCSSHRCFHRILDRRSNLHGTLHDKVWLQLPSWKRVLLKYGRLVRRKTSLCPMPRLVAARNAKTRQQFSSWAQMLLHSKNIAERISMSTRAPRGGGQERCLNYSCCGSSLLFYWLGNRSFPVPKRFLPCFFTIGRRTLSSRASESCSGCILQWQFKSSSPTFLHWEKLNEFCLNQNTQNEKMKEMIRLFRKLAFGTSQKLEFYTCSFFGSDF